MCTAAPSNIAPALAPLLEGRRRSCTCDIAVPEPRHTELAEALRRSLALACMHVHKWESPLMCGARGPLGRIRTLDYLLLQGGHVIKSDALRTFQGHSDAQRTSPVWRSQ